MGKKLTTAIVVAACLVAAGLIFYFHKPRQPTQIRHRPGPIEIVGVGIAIRTDPQTHEVVVQQIVPGSPAAKAGITSGLILSKVDGYSMQGRPLAECANLVRGPVGTSVQLELITSDHSQTNSVELTRQKLKL
jgi:C-terminal processing protease CtpA/Prc